MASCGLLDPLSAMGAGGARSSSSVIYRLSSLLLPLDSPTPPNLSISFHSPLPYPHTCIPPLPAE